MGSAVSSTARTAAQTALRETAGKQQSSNLKPSGQTSKRDPHVTARLNPAPEYHRKTTEEWSETLKKISGAISSSSWEGEVKAHMQNQTEMERHSAQRSDDSNTKLPGRQRFKEKSLQRNEHGALIRPEGRVSQNQILQMFNLRRADPQRWNVSAIAEKYSLKEEDVNNLLSFSRTYAARIDDDGRVRGYYNSDPNNTISRFEKD